MEKDFSSIVELKSIRKQIKGLVERENKLTTPVLSDLGLIPLLYEWFNEALEDYGKNPERITRRREFLFIVLYLYAPGSLTGGRLPDGLRLQIADVFGAVSASSVSNYVTNLIFFFERYRTFRRDVTYLYGRIIERLKSQRLIK